MSKWIDKSDPFGPFNFSDFKKWMSNQEDSKERSLVGMRVESKVALKKLLSRMETQEGDTVEVANDFKKNGGVIKEENGHYMYVDVESGNFLIHRMYLRRSDD